MDSISKKWKYYESQIIYVVPQYSFLDIAVLKIIDDSQTQNFPFVDVCHTCVEGEEVYILGYPVFNPHETISPTCAYGVISKIVLDRNQENSIIQTTAPVHNGNSGGMLLNK